MKNLIFVLLISVSSPAFCQGVWAPAVTFTYDFGGNRVVRQIEVICLGGGCPPILRHADTTKTTPGSQPVLTNTSKVKAYPNPVDNDLFVENLYWTSTDKATVIVYDINSKVVVNQEVSQAKDKISFFNLVPGSYLVQYYLNGNMVEVWKIIKK